MNKRYQRSSAKDTRGQTLKVLRKRKRRGGGERECVPLATGTDRCHLKVSPSRWARGSRCGSLALILVIHGFLMLKFNQENSKRHSIWFLSSDPDDLRCVFQPYCFQIGINLFPPHFFPACVKYDTFQYSWVLLESRLFTSSTSAMKPNID